MVALAGRARGLSGVVDVWTFTAASGPNTRRWKASAKARFIRLRLRLLRGATVSSTLGLAVQAVDGLQQGAHRGVDVGGWPRRAHDLRPQVLEAAGGHDRHAAGHHGIAGHRRLERDEDRFVRVVDLRVALEPAMEGLPPGQVAGDGLQGLGRLVEPPGHPSGEVAEEVLLAGEVLVERRPRAPRQLGDALDPALLVTDLAEHLQGRLEDAHLGLVAPLADHRAVGEGGATDDRGPVPVGQHGFGPRRGPPRVHRRGPVVTDGPWARVGFAI